MMPVDREAPHPIPEETASSQALGDLATLLQDLGRTIGNLNLDGIPGLTVLGPVERLIMDKIDSAPGITPSALATAFNLKTSNAAAALRALEGYGFITRTPDPRDRRVTHLYPTAAAHRNLLKVRQAWTQALAPALPPQVDADELVGHLTLLRDGLKRSAD